MSRQDTIVLIGPPAAGKSTIGEILSKRLGRPHVSLDLLRYDYYAEIGYDDVYAQNLRQTQGFAALVAYWKKFDAHAVERIMAEHQGSVIDFGAGHSVYEEESEFQRVWRALAPYPYVVLLTPSLDPVEAMAVIRERLVPVIDFETMRDVIEYHVRHPSTRRLAKFTVLTGQKSPEETVNQIINHLDMRSK